VGGERRWTRGLYERFPGFRQAVDAAYAFVARHLAGFAALDRVLIGNDQKPGTGNYFLTRSIFLRLLGVAYLAAFASLAVQVDGLIGSRGILPASQFLARVRAEYPGTALSLLPTLAWISASDTSLHVLCYGGVALSAVLILGVVPQLCLVLLWIFYLSLVGVGQDFLSFQWDALLLEAGFLAIFYAPTRLMLSAKHVAPPSKIVQFLFKWLLFRLMFLSGVVKITSGDPTWADWTAMGYHYETQPLPAWTSWYIHHLPAAFHKAEVVGTFAIELAVPLLFFAPRRLRNLAFSATVLLQVMITTTGNFGFFNLLTAVLCVLLLDDASWPAWLRDRRLPTWGERKPRPLWRGVALAPVAAVLLIVTTVQGIRRAHFRPAFIAPAYPLVQWLSPYRVTSAYGLFEVMTTERPEILIEGSDDGVTWKPYRFRYKPDDELTRRPRFCTPHMPRLDWQLWFAALGGDVYQSPWTVNLFRRLLEGSPPVLELFRENPFPDRPPRYVRATMRRYHFSTADERARTGAWWTPGFEQQTFCPPITLGDLRGVVP
jgi:lipase maturation factor 1